jgi:hypothetical protein
LAPLSLIFIELVGLELPLISIVFVETVVFVAGSLMTISDFAGGGASFGIAVISISLVIPSADVSSSNTERVYLPAFLRVNHF